MIRLLATLLLLAILGPLHSVDAQVKTYKFTHTYNNNGIESKCSFYVPNSYDPEKSYPLFYAWHGAGQPSFVMRQEIMSTIALHIDAIVVAPEANNIENNQQLQFLIDTTLQFIFGTYNIDHTRSITTGYSWGGRIAYEVGLNHPELFAGVIGYAPAVISTDLTPEMWQNISLPRMATIIGDQDFNFPLVDDLMDQILQREGNLKYTVKENVTHSDLYFESEEFKNDYRECYNYIIGENATTAVDRVDNADQFSVSHYPSPAHTTVHFAIPASAANGYDVVVRDITGRIHYQGRIETSGASQHWSLNCAAFPSGVYFAEIAAQRVHAVESFVVSHR